MTNRFPYSKHDCCRTTTKYKSLTPIESHAGMIAALQKETELGAQGLSLRWARQLQPLRWLNLLSCFRHHRKKTIVHGEKLFSLNMCCCHSSSFEILWQVLPLPSPKRSSDTTFPTRAITLSRHIRSTNFVRKHRLVHRDFQRSSLQPTLCLRRYAAYS